MFSVKSCTNFPVRSRILNKHLRESSRLYSNYSTNYSNSYSNRFGFNIENSNRNDENGTGNENLNKTSSKNNGNSGNNTTFDNHHLNYFSNEKRELILTILNSTATKREAQTYFKKYTPLIANDENQLTKRNELINKLLLSDNIESVNNIDINNDSEIKEFIIKDNINDYKKKCEKKDILQLSKVLRISLIKFKNIKSISPKVLKNIGLTILKLIKLGVSPIIVIDEYNFNNHDYNVNNKLSFSQIEKNLERQCELIVNIIEDSINLFGGDNIIRELFEINEENEVLLNNIELVLIPLIQGVVPIIYPSGYYKVDSSIKFLPSDLINNENNENNENEDLLSIEKIIYIDPLGGIPSLERSTGSHVLVNLEQEYYDIISELNMGFLKPFIKEQHISNLNSLRGILNNLPDNCTGIITSPEAAGIINNHPNNGNVIENLVIKNPIVYNILTDRPIISSSLPVYLKKTPIVSTSIIRKGLGVKLLKNDTEEGLNLVELDTKGEISLVKLKELIDDSFRRNLDLEHYLRRVNGKVAGLVIVGDYEGGAIITYESAFDSAGRMVTVPYLDKFAVKRKAQSSTGVADIAFKSMVKDLFPDELVWRSRSNNPVNKWYYERSKGNFVLANTMWRCFWVGEHTREHVALEAYAAICRSISPSWAS
ncbi:acetyl-CoA:L-glutamate N-acetyltransferase [Ascoidea rubescens DSM 1968]|uniref:Amino-acid acetyltransferase, mitochondrial n=1 Tax=Ascoidea rubescens DSM 1968 TaxID=1344418 RepID=A0A1D2V8D0_9ASCO|nr:N-acetylglutamate synthase [Ascoidea rubescens DSM 1968]ODV57858.1 N-acetylglutamate synthase [Ascoidea rubescens DSM 1968]